MWTELGGLALYKSCRDIIWLCSEGVSDRAVAGVSDERGLVALPLFTQEKDPPL